MHKERHLKKIFFLFGTRPEAIKMIPLIKACEQQPGKWQTYICVTGQHRQMLAQVLDFFGVTPHEDLALMKPGQTLFDITADGLKKLDEVLEREKPDVLVVQGDTTSAFTGALAAYYKKIKIAHIEAGLRSGNKYSPFPEEMNRKMTGNLADFHFAPTVNAQQNLYAENIREHVYVTGNTVIDALLMTADIIRDAAVYKEYFSFLDASKRTILVTGHRRESFGQPFEEICMAIRDLATRYEGKVQIVYPVHLNPQVQEPVQRLLKDVPGIRLIEPLDYPYLVWLMKQSYLVLTDSGGIQEEAPALGKPVLVMREVTERTEGIEAGTAKLVGTNRQVIVESCIALMDDDKLYQQMAQAVNPYGDGTTSAQIIDILHKVL
jgi:UDP-N-acetylglucosamine 2-epimerase (non-hydrolysing)